MFRFYVTREIDQWTRNGLLTADQAAALIADHDRRHGGFSLSGVLAVLAAVLFGAAVIALVAANWEAIARPVRVGLIMVLIVAGLGAAAIARRRGAVWVSEAALVFALLCYGSGIALVGQMYHLSGDEAGFMLTWTIGALVVSLSFSSWLAAVVSGLLGFGYLLAQVSFFDARPSDIPDVAGYAIVIMVALMVCLAAWRSQSRIAGHLGVLLTIAWLVWVIDEVTSLDPGYVLAAIGAAAFAVGTLVPAPLQGLVHRHGTVSSYGAALLLGGLGGIQAGLSSGDLAADIVLAALVLMASVAVLAIAGGHNRAVRRFAYFAFACETVYIVGETLGSLLGSSGFLFLGGIVLAVIAFAVMKLEKRFKSGEGRS